MEDNVKKYVKSFHYCPNVYQRLRIKFIYVRQFIINNFYLEI